MKPTWESVFLACLQGCMGWKGVPAWPGKADIRAVVRFAAMVADETAENGICLPRVTE